MATKLQTQKHTFEPILPDFNDWPLVKLTQDRKAFQREVIKNTVQVMLEKTAKDGSLDEEIASAIYQERTRMREIPWVTDPKDEKPFWNEINKRLLESSVHSLESSSNTNEEKAILQDIVTRYTNEIAGYFDIGTYRFGRKVLPHGFERFLSAKVRTNPVQILSKPKSIYERVQVTGELELIRSISKIGTVIMVPTHSSNLDSLVMGWGIELLGLPPFMYGAGLNLFNIRILAYFMNRLGAYKIDRRKKNNIYLETLKSYSSRALARGCHSLFFPGGTRSRSGAIEEKLKLGLLGTAFEAQRINFEQERRHGKKIFIVPVVLNYHFVIEAPTLISEYLQSTGQAKFYIDKDELSTSYKISKLVVKFFSASSRIALSFGKPMDLFGNYVDEKGTSYDARDRTVDVRKYFMSNGQIQKDTQRDSEYTEMLAERITQEYHRINIVFSSHLLAFTAFEILLKQYRKLDLYELLRLPEEEIEIAFTYFLDKVEQVAEAIRKMTKEDKIDMAPHLDLPPEELVEHGLKHLGQYHAKRPLQRNNKGNIITDDLKLLFFYHNRLTGYDLQKYV